MSNQRVDLPYSTTPYSLAVGFRAANSYSARLKCFVRGMGGNGSGNTTPSPKRSTTPRPKKSTPSAVKGCGVRGNRAANKGKATFSIDDQGTFSKETRIVNGRVAGQKSWPWMVFLLAGDYSCGATLINDRSVLTAAHCTEGFRARHLRVGLGCFNMGSGNRDHDCDVVSSISRNLMHPRYRDFSNDVAVLRLSGRVTSFSDEVRPVCLPPPGSRNERPGTRAFTTGWGRTGTNRPGSDRLKEAQVRLISDTECSRHYDSRTPDSVQCVFGVTGVICKVILDEFKSFHS